MIERTMASNSEAREFSEAEELYARLAKELVTFRYSAPYAEFEAKLLEVDAARERCEKARHALKAIRVKLRRQTSK
jgi:hypothetical protein